MKIGIVGAGRWGSTLAILLNEAGHEVTLCCRRFEVRDAQSTRRVPFAATPRKIPQDVKITSRRDSLKNADFVFLALPGKYFKVNWEYWQESAQGVIVNASKVMESNHGKLVLPHKIVGRRDFVHFACGAFPEGVLSGSPAIGTVYGLDEELNREVQCLFPSKLLRVYESPDLIGGQIGSALKNVIAIACGVARGLGYDEMTMAALTSRGAREIKIIAEKYGSLPETFGDGSTFLADLIGTCFSGHSHNCKAGKFLSKGFTRPRIESMIGTVEGFHTSDTLSMIFQECADVMPICKAVIAMAKSPFNIREAAKTLLDRPLKPE